MPSRRMTTITWLTVIFQCLFPLSMAVNPVVAAQKTATPPQSFPPSEDNGKMLAEQAKMAGSLLSSGNASNSATGLVRSKVIGEANTSAQQWLNQFGTARVQLNLDSNSSLNGSALDLLVPLYDDNKNLLFTQLGARHQDKRHTANVGVGVRTIQGNWMFGGNTFFDNDLTGHNRRIGVGAEIATDFLKLSANSYFGITDWHQSRDFADYNERPANGYDIRAEAYLPAYPQLGSKLMFEQYKGDDVALFGKDNRQKNPHAITAGLNYTPIPLLTVGAEHRAGKGSNTDSSINFQLNYRLGESWQSHIDPNAVAASRMLAGSRYDLVERNNNIVLDYQKQQLLNLSLPPQLAGPEGHVTPLTAQVTAKYGISQIDWDTAALTAAGGVVTQTSLTTVAVTFPPYQVGGNNSHVISAVARDTQGNISNRAVTTIDVAGMVNNTSTVAITLLDDNALADGLANNRVQVKVTSANGGGVANQVVNFVASNGASITPSAATNAQGIATATLTNLTAGISSVTSTVNGNSHSIDTNFVVNSGSAVIIAANMSVTTDNAVANGAATNAVQATVTDSNNNLLADEVVTFTATNGALVTTVIGTTGADGIATAMLTNTAAGTSAVTATLSNSANQTVNTNFVADSSNATISSANMTVTTNNATANGVATNAVRAIVTDNYNNRLADEVVTFTATNGALVTTVIGTTGADGIATVTLTNTVAGTSSVTAKLSNNASRSVNTTFVAPVAAVLAIAVDQSTTKIGETIQTTVTARDAGGELLSGVDVSFTIGNVINRQGNTANSGTLQFNGTNITAARKFTTGADGTVTIPVTDPSGTGVQRTITAVSGTATASTDVIYTVVTSPDTTQANMWGHMAETITVGGKTFKRPSLNVEIAGDFTQTMSNEVWGTFDYASAIGRVCGSQANLPVRADLVALYNAYPSNQIKSIFGWQTSGAYISSTVYGATSHSSIWLVNGNGTSTDDSNKNDWVTCLQ